jgi:hypothetical protein
MSQSESDDMDEDSWFEQNIIKLIIVGCLIAIAIACSIVLAVVLIKQAQRERALLEKKTTWTTRLEELGPIIQVATPIIKNIINVAFSVLLI